MARFVYPLLISMHKHIHDLTRGVIFDKFNKHSYSPLDLKLRLVEQRYLSSGSLQCWKCGSKRSTTDIFCGQCRVLLKPDSGMNYFEIFDLEPSYELKHSDLTSRYRKLQNVLHPDRFTNSTEEEKDYSSEYSALVNKAYATLLQPLARGLYMLGLEGVHLDESNVQSDPEFLMEIMEKNEEVDQAETYSEIASLDAQNKSMLETLTRSVADAFRAGDLKMVTEALIKMKYYVRIDTKIKELKLKTGIVE